MRASFHFVVEEKKVLDRTEKRKEEKHISEYDTLLENIIIMHDYASYDTYSLQEVV